jgi:hypothetical protein
MSLPVEPNEMRETNDSIGRVSGDEDSLIALRLLINARLGRIIC